MAACADTLPTLSIGMSQFSASFSRIRIHARMQVLFAELRWILDMFATDRLATT